MLINLPQQPLLNEIPELKNIQTKRRKRKIIIKLESEIEKNIKFELSHLIKGHSSKLYVNGKLKKGINRFSFKRNNNLQLVELIISENRLITIA